MRALCIGAMLATASLGGCALYTVPTAAAQRGDADGMQTRTTTPVTYDQLWTAAVQAMGQGGLTVVEQHRPSGTIRSRAGAGKVVALFITPTDARAPSYTIELVAKQAQGMGQPVRHHPEYAMVVQALQEGLQPAARR